MRELVLARLKTLLADDLAGGGDGLLQDFDDDLPTITTDAQLDALDDAALLELLELALGFAG